MSWLQQKHLGSEVVLERRGNAVPWSLVSAAEGKGRGWDQDCSQHPKEGGGAYANSCWAPTCRTEAASKSRATWESTLAPLSGWEAGKWVLESPSLLKVPDWGRPWAGPSWPETRGALVDRQKLRVLNA